MPERFIKTKRRNTMNIFDRLALAGLVPVIKVEDAQDAVPLCQALLDGGLPVAEITFRSAAAEQAIRNVKQALPEVMLGAGTVLTIEQVKAAVNAGAGADVNNMVGGIHRVFVMLYHNQSVSDVAQTLQCCQ